MALTENPVTTKVLLAAKNADLTLVEHHVVRRFEPKVSQARSNRNSGRFLPHPTSPATLDCVHFFEWSPSPQDRVNGHILQADELPWNRGKAPTSRADRGRDLEPVFARRKARRFALNRLFNLPVFDPWGMTTDESSNRVRHELSRLKPPLHSTGNRLEQSPFGSGIPPRSSLPAEWVVIELPGVSRVLESVSVLSGEEKQEAGNLYWSSPWIT